MGVLDVSGLKDSYNQQTLALVTSLASQIENQLYTQEIEDQKILLEKYMYLQQVKPYASILLNQHGYAVHMNNKMYELILKNILIDEKNIYDLLKKININNINIFFQNMV